MKDQKLPEFIIIGAMKAGTTSLHHILDSHSEIEMTKNKEPNYYILEDYPNSLDKYISQFGINSYIKGEASPNYAKVHLFPKIPQRIKSSAPKTKLIYIIRDPIERAISHIHHDLLRDRLKNKNISKNIRSNSDYIMTSSYHWQLSKFLTYFKKEEILIVTLEDLQENSLKIISEICSFLNCRNSMIVNNKDKFYSSESRYLIKFHDSFHKLIKNRKIRKLYHLIFYLVNVKIPKPTLSSEDLDYMLASLSNDVSELEKFTGKTFPNWNTYNQLSKLSV